MDLAGYALITGAASGISRACAKTFATEGAAAVALLDVNRDALAAVKAELDREISEGSSGTPCKIVVRQVDVANEEQVDLIVKTVVEVFGRLDYAVNAAGIALKHEGGAAFAKTTDCFGRLCQRRIAHQHHLSRVYRDTSDHWQPTNP